MSDTFKDGFYLRNLSYVNDAIPLRLVAYNANKVLLKQSAPAIPYPETRFVSTKHIGEIDFINVLIFFDTENFTAPTGMSIIKGQSGGGGSFGVNIGGNEFSVGVSATVTTAFAQHIGAMQIVLEPHKFVNGLSARYASWEIIAKKGDPDKTDEPYVFSYKNVTWPQGPTIGS